MNESDVIDPAAHERLREWGGTKLLKEMIRLFLENAGERMGQIATGFADGEVGKVEHGSHSLKSSAAHVGAERLRGFAADMEDRASRGDLEGARELHEPLQQACAEAMERLRQVEGGLRE